jgi:hypothetical protein
MAASKAGSGGSSTWPTGDRPGGAVVQSMPGREAVTHLIPGKGGVPSETTSGAGAR